MKRIVTLVLCVWISLLTGCATKAKDIVPDQAPTMQEIYEEHMGRMGTGEVNNAREDLGQPVYRRISDGSGDLAGYTRDAENELEARFTRLPNPTLVMYIYPHLSGSEGVPVPGYATSIPMYTRVHYALPGEAQ